VRPAVEARAVRVIGADVEHLGHREVVEGDGINRHRAFLFPASGACTKRRHAPVGLLLAPPDRRPPVVAGPE
jgi:hypothetical protein